MLNNKPNKLEYWAQISFVKNLELELHPKAWPLKMVYCGWLMLVMLVGDEPYRILERLGASLPLLLIKSSRC